MAVRPATPGPFTGPCLPPQPPTLASFAFSALFLFPVVHSLLVSRWTPLCCDMAFCECHLLLCCLSPPSLAHSQPRSKASCGGSLLVLGKSRSRLADCSPSCDSRTFFCPILPLPPPPLPLSLGLWKTDVDLVKPQANSCWSVRCLTTPVGSWVFLKPLRHVTLKEMVETQCHSGLGVEGEGEGGGGYCPLTLLQHWDCEWSD